MSLRGIRDRFGLAGNVLVTLGATLIVGMGEELWTRFMPKYLEVLGAGIGGIAVYGTLRDFLDSIYQYPGGWLADRLGRARSLMVFTLLSAAGYAVYEMSRSWQPILAGTLLAAAWTSLAQPAVFSVVGDSLPPQRRSIAFGLLAIVKRVPIIAGPLVGGWIILQAGLPGGMKISFLISIALAAAAAIIIRRFYAEPRSGRRNPASAFSIWKSFPPYLKRLLLADCIIRWAEGMPSVYVVLFVINVLGYSALTFGFLTSLQTITSMLVYIPVSISADRGNRRPFVLITFLFFALFPLLLGISHSSLSVVAAFVAGGLRELGEPARKAMIVDLAAPALRGRTIGLYYFIRGMAVFPASLAGGWLWTISPRAPFLAASALGLIAVALFAFSSPRTSVPVA